MTNPTIDHKPGIWSRPEHSGRGRRPEHTRAQIASVAVALADRAGLPSVSMRAVAAGVGCGAASLYRYVETRDELLELMADQVNGEFDLGPASGPWLDELIALARQARAIYLRHPWMVDALESRDMLGPNAIAFLEHALDILRDVPVSGRTKLESVSVLSALVRLLCRAEIGPPAGDSMGTSRRADQAAYLAAVVARGQHPHLTDAMAPSTGEPLPEPEEQFERLLRRALSGLLATDTSD